MQWLWNSFGILKLCIQCRLGFVCCRKHTNQCQVEMAASRKLMSGCWAIALSWIVLNTIFATAESETKTPGVSVSAVPIAPPLRSGTFSLVFNGNPKQLFTLNVDNDQWFVSAPIQFSANQTVFSTDDGSLILEGDASTGNADDAAGNYDFVTMRWRAENEDLVFTTIFKAYRGGRSALVFESRWPTNGVTGTRGSIFPGLIQTTDKQLGHLEYTGSSCGFMVSAGGDLNIHGGKGKGLIAIVPRAESMDGPDTTLCLGPVTEHFANVGVPLKNGIGYGMMDSFTFTPPGYVQETVLVATSKAVDSPGEKQPERASMPAGGPNAALTEYGDYVLARHNKKRAGPNHTNEVAHIGYSTTGFYFYNMCDCLDPDMTHKSLSCRHPAPSLPNCRTYEDTLVAVYDKLVQQGIPVKHILLDSWWYGEGVNSGAYYWEDIPECTGNASIHAANTFPSSLRKFYEHIGKNITLWAHNGIWVEGNPYLTKYPFAEGSTIPQGPELWRHLFKVNKEWGLNTIKQDHIAQQMGASVAWSNVTVLKSWMAGMGQGALENDAHILYCCAPPSIHMNGVTVPSAFSVRASPDYVVGSPPHQLNLPTVQWAIGPDAAFHWNALGLLPYKDTFFSNTSEVTMSKNSRFVNFKESNPLTHALMSTLSMAQVTFSDEIGSTNKTLVMMICREDGVVLKPDRPATAIDAQFNAMMFDSWPGPPTPGPAPSNAIFFSPCESAKAEQVWALSEDGALSIAANVDGHGYHGCMDASGCGSKPGTVVHIFDNVDGCGNKTKGNVCKELNEKWSLENGQIKSMLAPAMCVSLEAAGGATLQQCHTTPTFIFPKKFPGVILSASNSSLCLTATNVPRTAPTDWQSHGYSPSYAGALRISEALLQRLHRRARDAGEKCLMGPQGPLGEVYSTHTSIGNFTWHLVVGVQLNQNGLSVTPGMLGIDNKSQEMVQQKWSDSTTFRLASDHVPTAFSTSSPIQMNSPQECPGDGSGPVDQYHAPIDYHVVAPVFPSGWVFLGETGKLVPISRQRIGSLVLTPNGFKVGITGAPGESVELGAYNPKSGVLYQQCRLDEHGTASFQAGVNGPGVSCG